MKSYGYKKATEFSKKQINVVFGKAKAGELRVEKWVMKRLYELADYYGYDYNSSIEREERSILHMLNALFSGDLKEAQEEIDWYTKSVYSDYTEKYRQSFDRSLVK